jgi:ABC-type sulfate/molybdate transport systems ATPase subunit
VLEADVEVDRPDFTVRARLTVGPGERLALFGPSGAGKTTLLEAIAGLVMPRLAQITLAGKVLTRTSAPVVTLPPWRRRVGLLRQDPGLFPHLSVRDNLRYAGGRAEVELGSLATALGLEELLRSMPAALSGGQAHRVALGRLLLSRCDALLLDEPYSGLDLRLRRDLTELVRSQIAERGVPAIMVAHELDEAQAFADRIVVIDRGDQLQAGPPAEVVLRPASRRVAELVGYRAFVPLDGHEGSFGVHPDRVISGCHQGRGIVIRGLVTDCRPSGARWELDLRTAGREVVAVRLAEPALPGREITVTVTDPPRFLPDGVAA